LSKFADKVITEADSINKQIDHLANSRDARTFQYSFDQEQIGRFNYLLSELLSNPTEEMVATCAGIKTMDFSLSNIGKFVDDEKRFNQTGSFKISESYFGDVLSCSPSIVSGLIVYFQYWNSRIFVTVGSNKSVIAVEHSRKLTRLFESMIGEFLSPFEVCRCSHEMFAQNTSE
jgi:hypothetical protein